MKVVARNGDSGFSSDIGDFTSIALPKNINSMTSTHRVDDPSIGLGDICIYREI